MVTAAIIKIRRPDDISYRIGPCVINDGTDLMTKGTYDAGNKIPNLLEW